MIQPACRRAAQAWQAVRRRALNHCSQAFQATAAAHIFICLPLSSTPKHHLGFTQVILNVPHCKRSRFSLHIFLISAFISLIIFMRNAGL